MNTGPLHRHALNICTHIYGARTLSTAAIQAVEQQSWTIRLLAEGVVVVLLSLLQTAVRICRDEVQTALSLPSVMVSFSKAATAVSVLVEPAAKVQVEGSSTMLMGRP